MTTGALKSCRLSAAEWNQWAATGPPTAVTPTETDHFQQVVGPRPSMTAIDLACGTGQWTRQLAACGITVTGYDFSDEALRQAEAEGPRTGLSYALWDIVADPIPADLVPGTFDLVTCRYSLTYLEPGRLLTDAGRWLKPTGLFYALVHVGSAHDPGECSCREAPLHLGLTDDLLRDLGAGWARREVHHLGRCQRTLVLSGYGRTDPVRTPRDTHRVGARVSASQPLT